MKSGHKGCDLKSCSFCTHCLKDWLPAITANRQTFSLDKGEVLFNEGDEVKGMFFMYEGTVKVHKQWGEKELIIRFARKGEIVGHRGLGDELDYPVSATAIEASTVCFIPLDFFISSLKVNQEYLLKLMMFFAEELKVSERKMRDLAHMPVRGRVAQALLALSEKFGENDGFIDLPLSRQDLASYVGATYESVFRVLQELTEESLVKLSGKKIGIVDKAKLTIITNLLGGT